MIPSSLSRQKPQTRTSILTSRNHTKTMQVIISSLLWVLCLQSLPVRGFYITSSKPSTTAFPGTSRVGVPDSPLTSSGQTTPFSLPTAPCTMSSSITIEAGEETTAPEPEITASPDSGLVDDVAERFRQTTYWSCVKFPLTTHCGWHEPIIDASMPNAASNAAPGGRAGVGMAVLSGLVVSLVLLV